MDIYDVFFSICLGLFIGGIIMSIISFLLAEMSASDNQLDHMDHIDHLDHLDHIDHVDHVDHTDHFDKSFDKSNYFYHSKDKDNVNVYTEGNNDINTVSDIEPTPFMLIFSSSLLVFGFSGIFFCYILIPSVKFLSFIIPPMITYFLAKTISYIWGKIVKSRNYTIMSTQNLIGIEGEVVLEVDERGGVIKIKSNTPMRFEKVHVKSLNPNSLFKEGEKVYICDVKNNNLYVDSNGKCIFSK
ncbi:MAG: DUF1449 family protein [Candidatus Lokiarchaeota archaeon]|nr:DUF1449 family protein [Candidatus Lokiarchaeota archaeon]